MTDTPNPMSIGQFSSLTRLSVRMLRHYDKHDVLTPAEVDAASGYRLYTSDQLAEAADVRRLRDVGFGVSAIAALLTSRGTPAWEHALRMQRQSLTADLLAAQQHPADDLLRVGAELLVVVGAAPAHDLERGLVALLGLEEDLDSPGAGPSACAHSETRPR